MLLALPLQLAPTALDQEALLATVDRFHQACNWIATVAWQRQTFRRVPLHRLVYAAVRERFALGAQLTCLAIGQVVHTYQRMGKHKKCPHFGRRGSVPLDARVWS